MKKTDKRIEILNFIRDTLYHIQFLSNESEVNETLEDVRGDIACIISGDY